MGFRLPRSRGVLKSTNPKRQHQEPVEGSQIVPPAGRQPVISAEQGPVQVEPIVNGKVPKGPNRNVANGRALPAAEHGVGWQALAIVEAGYTPTRMALRYCLPRQHELWGGATLHPRAFLFYFFHVRSCFTHPFCSWGSMTGHIRG